MNDKEIEKLANFLLSNYLELLHKPARESDIAHIASIYKTVYHVLIKYHDSHSKAVQKSQDVIRDNYYFLTQEVKVLLEYVHLNQ